jgi:hypothetical protein
MSPKENPAPRANAVSRANSKAEQWQQFTASPTDWEANCRWRIAQIDLVSAARRRKISGVAEALPTPQRPLTGTDGTGHLRLAQPYCAYSSESITRQSASSRFSERRTGSHPSCRERPMRAGAAFKSASPSRDRVDFAAVNGAALAALPAVLGRLLPGGRRDGPEYVALNPRRADRHLGSFRINLRTGKWADFATGDRGGDPVSLTAFIENKSQVEAARLLARMLGVLP